jgi:secreted trypsin-like serine protease
VAVAAGVLAAGALAGGPAAAQTAALDGAVHPDVAHGNPAPAGAYPFAVKFTMTGIPQADGGTYDSACSGALVSTQWVITAGHCFHDVDHNPVSGPPQYGRTTATLGKTDLADTGGHVLDVVDVRQYPNSDVALAKLSEPVTDITPIRLARTAPRKGDVLRLAGWGATPADGAPTTHLQYGDMTVSSRTRYTVLVEGSEPAADTSACTYDSGAPYFARTSAGDVLVSVESDGPACPHTGPETTSRIDTIATWIDANDH